ncbi:hypothetical protein CRUP_017348 [Coryphaenoides rupestris]|nr:hypothetical protein CRUP_017348 [Coryphaenoides rupestris]
MGASLSRAAQWTTASSANTGTLATTPINESLLKDVLRFVEQFGSRHPQEAAHVFKDPLQWTTALVASDFNGDYDISGADVRSRGNDGRGHPLLRLSAPQTISVGNFSQLSKLVQLAGAKGPAEVGACLEENRNPVVKILGPGFGAVLEGDSDASALRLVDKLQEEEEREEEGAEVKVKLFLLLQHLDQELLSSSLRDFSQEVGLGPSAVKKEVELLKSFCNYEFSNGCHSPPWRQVHGEICYLVVEPCDTEALHITCSTAGVFLNQGIEQAGAVEDSTYEQTGVTFEDVTAMLKSHSPHFAQNTGGEEGDPCDDVMALLRRSLTKNTHSQKKKLEASRKQSEAEYTQQILTTKSKIRANVSGASQGQTPGHQSSQKSKASQETPSKGSGKQILTSHPASKSKIRANVSRASQGHTPGHQSSQKSKTEEHFSESSSESEEDEEPPDLRPKSNMDLPSEYWQIQKLVKLLKMGSLKILRKISQNCQIRQAIVDMGGLRTMVAILHSPSAELRGLAAETVAHVARFRRARRTVRRHGGIKRLVELLDCSPDTPPAPGEAQEKEKEAEVPAAAAVLSEAQEREVEVARCGALALWSCSKSTRNKEAIRRAGGVPLLARLLKSSPHESLLIPVTRDLVRQYKGLKTLVSLLSKADNKPLLAATTGAVWKCSLSVENVAKFQEYQTLEILVGLLTDQPEDVLVNVVGALGECAQVAANRVTIRKCGGIQPLVNLLTGTNQASSALRLLITQTSSLQYAGEMVRSFVGGMQLIVNMLRSADEEVLASACAAITGIAKDKENLAVITDYGVVAMLANLTHTTGDKLRRHLAEAVAACCAWESNVEAFREVGAVAPLVRYFRSRDGAVHRATAQALFELSGDSLNCITMHESGAVKS